MGDRTFVDTNVLVYMFDPRVPEKQERARETLRWIERGDLIVSTQVLQEFYYTVTRKLNPALAPEHAVAVVGDLARNPVVLVDSPLILAAIGRSVEDQLSYWDALIIESALSAGCERLLSEDRGFRPGSVIGSMRVEDPFA